MIRIAFFLAVIALLALGLAWFAERPGEIELTWQGWRVTTSLMVASVALLAFVLLSILLWSVLRLVLGAPRRIASHMEERRQLRGWRAISRGLIAIGTGNLLLASRSAGEARKLLAAEPLTLLLSAQAAQLHGDAKLAETEFRNMLAHPETKLLGLHGLFVEATRRNDPVAALSYAEEAARADPALGWAGDAVIEFRCRAGDWAGALEALEQQIAANAIGKAAGKRRRAVLLTAQAMSLEGTETARARELARTAAGLAPDLVPAAALAGRLDAAGHLRRGSRLIEKAFAKHPHPDLAEAYVDLAVDDSARGRVERAQALAKRAPEHTESRLAVARAAIDANDFGQARESLAPLLAAPTQRACLLMAEIEASEHGDHGKAREWTARAVRARRDPAWVADGYISERWLPISPLSGKLDAFVWTIPPDTSAAPMLEQVAQQALAEAAAVPARRPEPTVKTAAPLAADATVRKPPRRKAEAVVAEPPLPDDPGPLPDADSPAAPRRFRLFEWLVGPSP